MIVQKITIYGYMKVTAGIKYIKSDSRDKLHKNDNEGDDIPENIKEDDEYNKTLHVI